MLASNKIWEKIDRSIKTGEPGGGREVDLCPDDVAVQRLVLVHLHNHPHPDSDSGDKCEADDVAVQRLVLVQLQHHDVDCDDIAGKRDDDSGIGEAFARNDNIDDGGDRISEDNSLSSKPLDGLEDDIRRSKLSGVDGPVHLDPVGGLINIDHLGGLRLLKDGNVFGGEKEKV